MFPEFTNFGFMDRIFKSGKIRFFFESHIDLKNRTDLKAFIQRLIKNEKHKAAGINIIFVGDDRLLQVNREFLQHDFYTDIITFQYNQPGELLESDIYISTDRIRENAAEHHTAIRHELHRVIFHGILHLCGYGDKSRKDKQLMTQMEDHYLELYFK